MSIRDRIRMRRDRGVGLVAWLVDRDGWRWIAAQVADMVAEARYRSRGPTDPIAIGADAVGDAVGQVGDGDE